MQCPRCQHENAPTMKFCEECGTPRRAANLSGPPAPSYAEITTALSESIEQQTATSEVLKAISRSTFDLQPVLDTLIENATRLCGAEHGHIYRFDGELLQRAAGYGSSPEHVELRRRQPVRLWRGSLTGRAALDRRVVHVPDVLADPEFGELESQRLLGVRTGLSVPLLKEEVLIGVLAIWRTEVRPFTDKQIELVTTFADQAVIAIENVRLFTELQEKNRALTEAHAQVTESLEQQTATSQILRVISSSPTDVQPVFDAIAASAVTLCEALNGGVFRFDGSLIHLVAHHNWSPDELEAIRHFFPIPPGRGSVTARAILTGAVAYVLDPATDPEFVSGISVQAGLRTTLSVPMLRDGNPIGAITVTRREVKPFSDTQIALLQTFADQAVIAIENVRLFQELEARNRDLTEALEQQTATSEILRVISDSPTDVQPVFDAITRSAVRLCDATFCSLHRFDGELVHQVASHNFTPEALEVAQRVYPAPLTRQLASARAILDRAVSHIPDTENDPEYNSSFSRVVGNRSLLAVPMLREGSPVGAISVARAAPGPFAPRQIELLQTFADQAVIAIENVRLFKELQEKNQALTEAHAQVTEALEQQTATSEVLKVISRSTFDLEPVLSTLIENATRLCGVKRGLIWRLDGELYRAAIAYNIPPGFKDISERTAIRAGRETIVGRVALERRTVHIPDVLNDAEYQWPEGQRFGSYRTVLGVPMLREGTPIGVIVIWGDEVQPFTDEQIDLVETFADQAVIAIENVRLFKELQARTRELGRSVDELKALSEVSGAVSSTLDLETVLTTIVSRAAQLAGADGASIHEYDETTREFPLRDPQLRPGARREPPGHPAPDGREPHGARRRAAGADPGARHRPGGRLPEPTPGHAASDGLSGAAGGAPGAGGPDHRRARGEPAGSRGVPAGGRGAPEDVRHPVGAGHPERPAVPRDRRQKPAARGREPPQVGVPREHVPRAADAPQRRDRLLGGPPGAAVRGGEREADRVSPRHSLLRSAPPVPDQRHPRSVQGGGRTAGAGARAIPSACRPGQCGDPGPGAGDSARDHAHPDGGRGGGRHRCRRAEGEADPAEPPVQCGEVHPGGGGRVCLTATTTEGVITISVSDTGVGIAPEDQAAIFEEFRQVGRDDARKQEGTGLGLTLAKKFVELHGGRIWVQSQVGQGSTFTFTLPARPEGRSSSDESGGAPPPSA